MNDLTHTPTYTLDYRVIFADTDAGGIVYHARYLELAERGRNEAMRRMRLDVGPLFVEQNVSFALRSCTLQFHKPAIFDDLLTIHTSISKLSAATSIWVSKVKRGPMEICSVQAEIICMDRIKHKPVLFPENIAAAMSAPAPTPPPASDQDTNYNDAQNTHRRGGA